jgi:hypothetical protein
MPAGKAAFWLDVLVSGLLPWLIYQWVQPRLGELPALWWSAIPPTALALVELAWQRRVDAISALSLAGIVLSLVVMALGGDARMILVRESLITGAVGVVGLSSMCWPRPALFYLARAAACRGDSTRGAAFDANWALPGFRRALSGMTWIWSGGMVAEALLRCLLAWRLSAANFLLCSPFVQYGTLGLLMAWTIWYRVRLQGAMSAEVPA